MALLWMDSFDHYATADIIEKYPNAFGGSNAILAGLGRRGTNCFRGFTSSNGINPMPTPSGTTCIVGVALQLTSAGQSDAIQIVLGATVQLFLRISNVGVVSVLRGTTVLGTPTVAGTFPIGSYVYVEMKAVLHPSAGSVVVRLNEATVINVPTANTAQSGLAGWDYLQLVGPSSGSGFNYFDDFYILDGSGSAPHNDFLGDCRVDARYPTAEGASSAWTPSTGTDNALLVDDTAPDDDTTYVTTATVGATDTHVVQDVAAAGAVLYGVQVVTSQKKSDAGTCSVAPVIRHASTDYVGTAVNPGTSYRYAAAPYGLNPGTGLPWTEADFNAAEFGYQRTA